MPLPKIYDFPPLYTKQPNAIVYSKQLETWCNIILTYCQENNIYKMNNELIKTQLFENAKIQRSVSVELEKKIWERMSQMEKLVFLKEDSQDGTRIVGIDTKRSLENGIVLWKSVEEWGSAILNYMVMRSNGGSGNSIFTLYELQTQSFSESFQGIDIILLRYVMKVELCQNRKRVVLMYEEDPEEEQFGELVGVKLV